MIYAQKDGLPLTDSGSQEENDISLACSLEG